MTNDKLPVDELTVQFLESISNEADEVTNEKANGRSTAYKYGYRDGYFIGATAWAPWKVRHDELQLKYDAVSVMLDTGAQNYDNLKQEAQRMADALDELIELKRMKDELGKTTNYLTRQPAAWKRATEELQQFKDGKGEGMEKIEPTISKCGMCKKEGVNQYLGSQFYLCDECFEDYENQRDQP